MQVPWPPVKGSLEGLFHQMRSLAVPVPFRDMHQQSYKVLQIHELSSRAGPVASRAWLVACPGCLWLVPGRALGGQSRVS